MVDDAGLAICKFSRYVHKKHHLRGNSPVPPSPTPTLEEMLEHTQHGMYGMGWQPVTYPTDPDHVWLEKLQSLLEQRQGGSRLVLIVLQIPKHALEVSESDPTSLLTHLNIWCRSNFEQALLLVQAKSVDGVQEEPFVPPDQPSDGSGALLLHRMPGLSVAAVEAEGGRMGWIAPDGTDYRVVEHEDEMYYVLTLPLKPSRAAEAEAVSREAVPATTEMAQQTRPAAEKALPVSRPEGSLAGNKRPWPEVVDEEEEGGGVRNTGRVRTPVQRLGVCKYDEEGSASESDAESSMAAESSGSHAPPAPLLGGQRWRSKGHAWVESRCKVRRFFETTLGGVGGTVTQYLPPGKDEKEDPEMWHVVHDGDGDEEDLDLDEVVDALIAKDPQAWGGERSGGPRLG